MNVRALRKGPDVARGPRRGRPARRRAEPAPGAFTRTGVLVLVALILVTYLIFARGLPGGERWTVSAVVSDTAQIVPGSPVRIAGVQVGTVTGVERGPGATARLVLDLEERGRPLHTDATIAIQPRLFLEGSYYVDLRPGSPSAPAMDRGDTIPLGQTSIPVQFVPVISTFTDDVRRDLTTIVTESARSLDHGGARGLRDTFTHLGPAFRHGAEALDASLGSSPGTLSSLIRGAERVSSALAAEAPALASLITNANAVAGAVAAEDEALTASIAEANMTLARAPDALRRTRAAMPSVRTFASALRPALRAAPPVLRRAVPVLDQLRALSRPAELPRLLELTARLSPRISSLAPKLRELLPRMQRVSRCAGDEGLEAVTRKIDDGPFTNGQPLWQEFAHAYVNGTSISQSFDAYGNFLRAGMDLNINSIALGSVPGVGVLLGDLQAPITGTRPIWNGPTPPPFRPDVPCGTHPLRSFASAAGPGPATKTIVRGVPKLPSDRQVLRAAKRLAKHMRTPGAGR